MNDQTKKSIDYSGKLTQPPVFVVGYMHSGTTLLINILKSHSTVFSGNRETKYFMNLPMIKKTFPNLEDDEILRKFVFYVIKVVKEGFNKAELNPKVTTEFRSEWFGEDEKRLDVLLEQAKQHRDYRGMFGLVSNHLTQSMGKSRWFEKTPTHIFHLDEIIEKIPDALFVEIIRDPRDVLASKKTRRLGVWESEKYAKDRWKKHLEKGFDPFWDTLSWQSAIRAGQKAHEKYPDRIFTVKYEDLTTNPEQKVREVCEFLDLRFEPEMLNITTRNTAEEISSEAEKKGIVTTSIGRWQKTLNMTEVAVCQWQVKKDLNNLGYLTTSVPLIYRLKIPFALFGSLFEFIQRSFRRFQLGGWSYFQTVFVNYWKRFKVLVFRS